MYIVTIEFFVGRHGVCHLFISSMSFIFVFTCESIHLVIFVHVFSEYSKNQL